MLNISCKYLKNLSFLKNKMCFKQKKITLFEGKQRFFSVHGYNFYMHVSFIETA